MAAIARVRIPLRSSVTSTPSSTLLPICSLPTRPSTWKWRSTTPPTPQPQPSLSSRTFTTSRTLSEKKYTTDHEWIELSPDGKTGTIGISTYASKALGDVVFVELPAVPLDVAKGDTIGAVESVKSASDIMTPVSGKIIEANGALEEKPGIINKGPEGEGWIARIELKEGGEGELEELMSKEGYEELLGDSVEEGEK